MRKDLSSDKTCASKVMSIVEIPHGVRIQADNLLTLDIAGFAKGDVVFTLTRLLGYEGDDRGYVLFEAPEDTIPEAGEDEVILGMGDVTVRIGRTVPDIRVERDGKPLFSIGESGIGYEKINGNGENGTGRVSMSVQLSLGASESIWGFGGKGFGFVKNQRSMKNTFPVYYSDKGYALLCDHRDGACFSVGKDDPGKIEISVPGEQLSFHVISGKDPREIIGNLKKLVGMPALPSASGFGSWLFADPSTFYDAEAIDSLHKEGFRICMNAGPFIRQDDILFAEGLEKGYFLKREDGRGIRQEDGLPGAPALIDITDPDAAKWYAEKVKELLDKGVDGISSYYPELLTELLAEVNGDENKGEQVSFFSGNPGPDAISLIYRTGNTDGGFSCMAQCLRHGLSMLFGGTSYFSHEISQETAKKDPAVFKRWVQFGCFSTHFGIRLCEPGLQSDLFDGEELEVFKKFSGIRNMLMPYIYEQAVTAHETGFPVIRPMALAFPEDPACRYLDMQYMLGESVLVAPVFEADGKSSFYLPSGRWKNLLDDEILDGAGYYERTYDAFHMAVFVKENTLLPVGGENGRPDYEYTKGLTIHYFLPAIGKGVVMDIRDTSGNRVMSFKGFFDGGKAEVRMIEPTGMGKVPVTVHMPDGTEESGYTL